MSQAPGLRERKKLQTRQLIAETARRLFAERSFESVTVADVARAADVSEATVFNYFPTKEDLFYSGLEAFEEELLTAIRERDPGESALGGLGPLFLSLLCRFVLEPRGLLQASDTETAERFAAISRVIEESPALLAREQRIFAGYTDSLAALLAEETSADAGDVRPWVAANALMGVHRALVGHTRRAIVAGARNPQLARGVRIRTKQALALLDDGLGDYAIKD
jgi:AcrR family transcriptional regulator